MPSRRLLGCFEKVKRKVCSHPTLGVKQIKTLAVRPGLMRNGEFREAYKVFWRGGYIPELTVLTVQLLHGWIEKATGEFIL